jgi:hypothetical protein
MRGASVVVVVAAVASVAAVTTLVGCPGRRDLGDAPPAPPAPGPAGGGTKSLVGAALPPAPSDTVADVPAIAPLTLGAPLPRDTLDPLDPAGLALTWIVTPRDAPTPPLPAESAARDAWSLVVGEGRAAIQFGPHSSLARDGSELRFEQDRAGALHVLDAGHYRIVPAGALRAFLDEGRADVLPLAPSTLVPLEASTRFGRPTVHARVTTTYGAVDLEQIVLEPRPGFGGAPSKAAPSGVADARVDATAPPGEGLEGAGGALCRFLLDLVASDRVLGGEPCAADRVPVHIEVSYVAGGGLVIDGAAVRDAVIARDDLAFPPFGATLALPSDPHDARLLVPATTLLALRPKGDTVSLDLSNEGDRARVALLDGLPVLSMPAHSTATLSVRAATYRFEWRSPIGEIVEAAADVQAPAKISAQFSPSLGGLGPAPSAMASVLKPP